MIKQSNPRELPQLGRARRAAHEEKQKAGGYSGAYRPLQRYQTWDQAHLLCFVVARRVLDCFRKNTQRWGGGIKRDCCSVSRLQSFELARRMPLVPRCHQERNKEKKKQRKWSEQTGGSSVALNCKRSYIKAAVGRAKDGAAG